MDIRMLPPVSGCLLDGVRGWYITPDTVDFAVEHGYPIERADAAHVATYRRGEVTIIDDGEEIDLAMVVNEVADEALAWMNSHITPDGYLIDFHDGDLIIWTYAEKCVASGDWCQCDELHEGSRLPSTEMP